MRPEFKIGDVVYSVLGEHKGFVTGIQMRDTGIFYLVTWGHDLTERFHYVFELSTDCRFDCGVEEGKVT